MEKAGQMFRAVAIVGVPTLPDPGPGRALSRAEIARTDKYGGVWDWVAIWAGLPRLLLDA
jgi:hypothetical protein